MFGLLDSLFDGDSSSSEQSEIAKLLEEHISDLLINGAPNIEMPDIYNTLYDTVSNQLNPDNLGYSDDELETIYGQAADKLNDARKTGVSNTIEGMNSRGILSSDLTTNALSGIEENYSDSLSDAYNNLQLQNKQLKNNQLNNAINMGMNLGQWQTGVDQFNTGLDMSGLGYGLSYLNYLTNQEQIKSQSDNDFWNAIGGMAGSLITAFL